MYYILVQDFGYGDLTTFGLTSRKDLAEQWESKEFVNEFIAIELDNDSLPSVPN